MTKAQLEQLKLQREKGRQDMLKNPLLKKVMKELAKT